MARTRSIKPEFWDDEKLATVCRDARLAYIGLWTNSDDYGVVKGHPAFLKNKIFPYDEIKIKDFEVWIREIESLGMILPFTENGEKYYYIKRFLDHQSINHPSKRIYPKPPSNFIDALPEDSRNTPGGLPFETETETETEEKEKKDPPRPENKKIRYLDSVWITELEYKRLQEAMGQKNLENGIEQLDYSITVKGGKYKDHYKTLLNWFKRGFISGNGNGSGAEVSKPKRVPTQEEDLAEFNERWDREHAAGLTA